VTNAITAAHTTRTANAFFMLHLLSCRN